MTNKFSRLAVQIKEFVTFVECENKSFLVGKSINSILRFKYLADHLRYSIVR